MQIIRLNLLITFLHNWNWKITWWGCAPRCATQQYITLCMNTNKNYNSYKLNERNNGDCCGYILPSSLCIICLSNQKGEQKKGNIKFHRFNKVRELTSLFYLPWGEILTPCSFQIGSPTLYNTSTQLRTSFCIGLFATWVVESIVVK